MVLLSLVAYAPLLLAQIPCHEPNDFLGEVALEHGGTCQDVSAMIVPSSAAECISKPDGSTTKADMLKYLYGNCCRQGSKPNGICGFELSTATPCRSKADGEFLPDAK